MRQVLALLGRGAGAAVLLGSPAVWGADQVTGVARVIDGDTLAVQGVRVRLWAVDAPETDQTCQHASGQTWPCGRAATEALKERLGDQPVTCRRRDTDQYGRMVAVCSVDDTDLGAWLLINGWAIPYWRKVPAYSELERVARSNRAGLWSGSFDRPSDWRRARR